MIIKGQPHQLSSTIKASVLQALMQKKDPEAIYQKLSAAQMQALREYLIAQVSYLSGLHDRTPLQANDIKSDFEPIPNYYYKQDCREPLESCINETCFGSYPSCFSRKIRTQLLVVNHKLTRYLVPESAQASPKEDSRSKKK